MSKHIKPTFASTSFHCPFCGVLSRQQWSTSIQCYYTEKLPNGSTVTNSYILKNTATAKCNHCENVSFWKGEKMIYPTNGTVEQPNDDLPDDIKSLYREAGDILVMSPRGAAALLRLGLQKLCEHLGEGGKNINADIESLVRKGLPITVQQALDIIRVTGNHAVHPGTINFDDEPENAYALFGFTNFICNHFITNPKIVAEFYGKLPEKDRQNISRRKS